MTANTVRSRKNKGRLLQNEVVRILLKRFPDLTERDIRSTSMGVTGADIQLSEKGSKKFPYSIESKNQEKLNIWKALKQTESDTKERNLTPLLVFKRNRSEIYCTLRFEEFMKLIK